MLVHKAEAHFLERPVLGSTSGFLAFSPLKYHSRSLYLPGTFRASGEGDKNDRAGLV